LTEALTSCLKYHGTIFNTCTASGAAVLDDTAGAFSDFDLEIAGRSLDAFKVRIGDQFDV